MDIPLLQTVLVQTRGTEGAYGPTWGATATYSAHAAPSTKRLLSDTGEEVVADLFVVLEPTAVVAVGDAVEFDGSRYHVLTYKKFENIPGVPGNIQLRCKSVAEALAG